MTSQPSPPDAAGAGAFSSPFAGNVADLVLAAASRSPDHPALVEPAAGVSLSWSQLHAAVEAEAARLRGAGVRAGERVLVRLGHGIPYCVALLGAVRAGAIAVPVGTHSTERELAAIVADCTPVVLVAQESDPVVASVRAGAGGASLLLPPPVVRTADAAAAAQPDGPPAGRGGEDIAVLGYTSGTTGAPRGVRLSHRALLANRAQTALLRPVPVSPADRVLLQLPLFHIYGLGAGLLQVCWSGATGVLVDRLDPDGLLDVVGAERVTVLAGVPPTYRALLALPRQRLRDGLVTVRLCVAGGAPLSPTLLREFSETAGLELFDGYGLTETGPVLTSTLVSGVAKPGSVGRPLPGGPGVAGVELRLVDAGPEVFEGLGDPAEGDPDGGSGPDAADRVSPAAGAVEVPEDDAADEDRADDRADDWADDWADDEDEDRDTGLVAVRGPNLFSGYWPDGAGGPDADGWFRTCDVGFVDADGDLHLVDRASDLLIVNGFNVYPHEVEEVLTEHPSVAEAAVVGVPDARTGEAVKAVLVLRPGTELTAEQVREYCATRLARFKHPTVVEFVDRLPHSATGKIVRMELRAGHRQ